MTIALKSEAAWRFWGSWGLAFIGFPLGGLAASALVGGIRTPLDGALGGLATGAVLGLAQWLVLRRRLALTPWWIAATATGMGAGLALGIALLGTDTAGIALPLRSLVYRRDFNRRRKTTPRIEGGKIVHHSYNSYSCLQSNRNVP